MPPPAMPPPIPLPLLPPRLPKAGRWGGRRSVSSRWPPRCGLKGLVVLVYSGGEGKNNEECQPQ